jgi:hypothetical protein
VMAAQHRGRPERTLKCRRSASRRLVSFLLRPAQLRQENVRGTDSTAGQAAQFFFPGLPADNPEFSGYTRAKDGCRDPLATQGIVIASSRFIGSLPSFFGTRSPFTQKGHPWRPLLNAAQSAAVPWASGVS